MVKIHWELGKKYLVKWSELSSSLQITDISEAIKVNGGQFWKVLCTDEYKETKPTNVPRTLPQKENYRDEFYHTIHEFRELSEQEANRLLIKGSI